jgi:sporulation protein YlmC with PRC-barrel domain
MISPRRNVPIGIGWWLGIRTLMDRLLLCCQAAILLMVVIPIANGQQTSSKEEKLSATSQDQVDVLNKPVENQIQLASKLLQTMLTKEDSPLGRIGDLAFDLETEHLAVLVATRSVEGNHIEWTLLPFINGDRLVKFDWENDTKLKTSPMALTRMQANDVYRRYKEAVYWSDFAKLYEKTFGAKFDDQDFKLSFYSSLRKTLVADVNGQVIGRINDVALKASNGTILYMVMETEGRFRAVPLGAFVADVEKSRWLIELTKDQILKFKTFEEKSPPAKIDRGWQEYVAVKYGRGGLQTKKN